MKNGISVKTKDIGSKIEEHTESLKKTDSEILQLQQVLSERQQQKIALTGAIQGLQEFMPQEDLEEASATAN
jgi:septal ring factor EnvC (AmiA/AmiB activator)